MVYNELLKLLAPQDTVAHVGPSILYGRFDYFRHTPANIVIAEPDPGRAARALREVSGTNKCKLIESAVLPEDQRAEMRQYNFESLSSFCDPGVLKKLFPGLQETDRQIVNLLPVSNFLMLLPEQHRANDLLIIDSLGAEFSILKKIDAENALTRFSGVVVRMIRNPASGGNDRVKEIQDWLLAKNFDRAFLLDGADPDLPIFFFQRNQIRDELEKQNSVINSLRTERDSHRANFEKTREQAQKAESDLRVTTRLHSAAQDDLKDLQRQYSALYADKLRQDKLLQQVTRKLAFASEYLHRLAVEAPEFARLMENSRLDNNGGAPDEHGPTSPDDAPSHDGRDDDNKTGEDEQGS